MEYSRIKALLEKYWEAETSLEEESELKTFFNSDAVPNDLEEYKYLFVYFSEEQKKVSTIKDEELLGFIEKQEQGEAPTKMVSMWYSNYSKIAAVLLFLVVATFFINKELSDENIERFNKETFETPEEAFAETKKALQMLSKNLGKGKKEAKKIAVFNKAQEEIKN